MRFLMDWMTVPLRPAVRVLLVLSLLWLALASVPQQARAQNSACPEASNSADITLPNGRLYTQAVEQPGRGFPVTDEDGILFWSEFQRLGGVPGVGYPISQRFVWNGFVSQAFQKAVLQWRPEVGQVYAVNVVDQIREQGLDDWLRIHRATPPIADWSADAERTWPEVISAHQALLTDPEIRATYFAVPDPLTLYGLPMAPIQDMGNVLVLRMQRGILQKWLVDVPWAQAGQVTVANGGDLAKEAGLLPNSILTPLDPTPQASVPAEAPRQIIARGLALAVTPDLIERQAQASALVVLGTITDVSPPQWNTPDGQRPANPNLSPNQCGQIVRVVTLDVRSYLKGSAGQTSIQFTQAGGRIGEDVVDIQPNVEFQPGQQAVVFLQPQPDRQQGGLPHVPYSAGTGRFIIREGDTVVDGWNPSWTMPLADFADLVAGRA